MKEIEAKSIKMTTCIQNLDNKKTFLESSLEKSKREVVMIQTTISKLTGELTEIKYFKLAI